MVGSHQGQDQELEIEELVESPMEEKKNKVRKNFVFPADIVKWAEKYANDNNTTLTRILLDHLTKLRSQVESGHVDRI